METAVEAAPAARFTPLPSWAVVRASPAYAVASQPAPDTRAFPSAPHRAGFYEDYTSMSSQLISALDSINSANAPYLALSGHSLGAAQANLAAFELALAGYPVAVAYNFGQPRVGDATYAASFISMIINGQDSVSAASAPRSLLRAHKHATHRRSGAGANHTVHSVAPHRLNAAALANPAVPEALLSHVMAKAIARAVGHPINAGVAADAAEAAALVARVAEHAAASTAHVAMKKAAAKRGLNVTRSAQVSRTPYTPRQLEILAALRFPLAEYRLDAATSAAIGGPSVTELPLRDAIASLPAASKLGGFSGTQFYRVVHWQDIVPHVPPEVRKQRDSRRRRLLAALGTRRAVRAVARFPGCCRGSVTRRWGRVLAYQVPLSLSSAVALALHPAIDLSTHFSPLVALAVPLPLLLQSFGFTHAVEEAWYSEDFSSYTACSTSNGEDPNCSDSVGLPISVSDHLEYFNIPISNLC
jgi:hypothetical protein